MGPGLAGCKWAICEQAINRLSMGPARHLLTKSNGPAFSQEWASVGPCHVSTYHRRLLSNEWMTSVPTVSQHVFPLANADFTPGKSPLVRAISGLSDPKTGPDISTAFRYGGCHVSVTLDESTSVTGDLSSWKWTLP